MLWVWGRKGANFVFEDGLTSKACFPSSSSSQHFCEVDVTHMATVFHKDYKVQGLAEGHPTKC